MPWQERERQLYAGEIHAAWICGLPYVLRADVADWPLELLAAPVIADARYGDRPIYFSDIVVHRDSLAFGFEDCAASHGPITNLAPTRSQPGALPSGDAGRDIGLFRSGDRVRRTPPTTLRTILNRHVDASAIDGMAGRFAAVTNRHYDTHHDAQGGTGRLVSGGGAPDTEAMTALFAAPELQDMDVLE